jgi:predicted Zn-dependent protease
MKKYLFLFFSLILFFIYSCSTVPLTGRKHLSMIPGGEMLAMSEQQYGQFLQEHQLSNDKKAAEMVINVGNKIKDAVTEYLVEHNRADLLEGYQWEFNLVEDEQANAWCMPGGKVVVYTGILPITEDKNGLAVVLAHEIAHAIAEHGNERMSQEMMRQLGGVALTTALKNKPVETQNMWLTAYGIGTEVGAILPYSRLQESEADHLGLIFMAMAGYDPHTAIEFWERMRKLGGTPPVPEFLSTHPSNETRIEHLKKWMPEAEKYYKKELKNNAGNKESKKNKAHSITLGK